MAVGEGLCMCWVCFCVWTYVCTHVPMLLRVSVCPLWKNQIQSCGCKNSILKQKTDSNAYERLHYAQHLGGSVRGQSTCPVPRAIRMSSGAREDDLSCSCAVTLAQLPQSGIQTGPTTKGHGPNLGHYPASCTVDFKVAKTCNLNFGINLMPVYIPHRYSLSI